jgi:DNA-binding SARP family transcriptional activator
MERSLLAVLVVRAGQYVSSDFLIEELWHGEPPAKAANTLQTYVAHLRPMLEPDREPGTAWQVLRTQPQGYVLDHEASDGCAFTMLTTIGTTHLTRGCPPEAEAALTKALALWRGDRAFSDVRGTVCVDDEARRLDGLRLRAARAGVRALLELGRVVDAAVLAEDTLRLEPLDEGLAALTVTALGASGRTAEARQVSDEVCRGLRDELDVAPGPELREARAGLHPAVVMTSDRSATPGRRHRSQNRSRCSPRWTSRRMPQFPEGVCHSSASRSEPCW